MSFIFISYSRQDQAYVSQLIQALEAHQLPVWLDDRIDYGTTWPRVIQDQLEKCQVFLLVMSPRSEDSHWVQCELTLALELKKPIFPILLEGGRWLSVAAIQTVDALGDKLPPIDFFEDIRRHFTETEVTAQSLSIQDVVTEQIAVPQVAQNPIPIPEADDLASAKGVDYTRLRDLLKAQNFKDADYETCLKMLEAVGRTKEGWIRWKELQNFPCTDLKTIDRLWVKYSNGKFGFSVQKKIWQECGSPKNYNKDFGKFGDRVGWRALNRWRRIFEDEWIFYNEVNFDTSAQVGHLPAPPLQRVMWQRVFNWLPFVVSSLAWRLEQCNR